MIEPVATGNLMAAAIAGALIVLLGALYALFYALGRLLGRDLYLSAALAAYLALAGAVAVLAHTLNLSGPWRAVTVAMLLGYFLAPRAVWRLCVGTHGSDSEAVSDGRNAT